MKELAAKDTFYDRLIANQEWDSVTNRYETARRLELIFGRLLSEAAMKGQRFLDAGSGGGHFSAAAAAAGADVYSLDVGMNLLRQVAARCQSRRVLGSVLELPFAENTFDIVLATEIIEHTRDPLRAVRRLCRVVAPGGLILVTTPCRLWQPVVRLATRLRLRPYNGHENFLWLSELVATVRSKGFRIEWAQGFNFCPFFWRAADPAFRLGDYVLGHRAPWLMVNIGIFARKLSETRA